jgi:hypothetical protein
MRTAILSFSHRHAKKVASALMKDREVIRNVAGTLNQRLKLRLYLRHSQAPVACRQNPSNFKILQERHNLPPFGYVKSNIPRVSSKSGSSDCRATV